MRLIWLAAGLICLSLGAIGAVLPLLPTVPFLLLATFCFARSSQRLHDWLVNHRFLGPPIVAWQKGGVIGRRAKFLASGSILATFVVSLWLNASPVVLVIQALVLSGVTFFIWSRPEHLPKESDTGHLVDRASHTEP